jgi:hypothetical protein
VMLIVGLVIVAMASITGCGGGSTKTMTAQAAPATRQAAPATTPAAPATTPTAPATAAAAPAQPADGRAAARQSCIDGANRIPDPTARKSLLQVCNSSGHGSRTGAAKAAVRKSCIDGANRIPVKASRDALLSHCRTLPTG